MVSTMNQSYNVRCNLCSKEYNIIADRNDMEAWISGDKYIQDALDYLTAAERELLISKTCGSCWNNLYPNDLDMEE